MKEELLKIAKEIDNFSKKYNCRLDIEVYEQNYIDTGKTYYKYVLRAVIPEKSRTSINKLGGIMLVKTNLKEIIEHIVKNDIKITDNSCCGQCSKCGECCTNFLPVTQKEIEIIQEYVIANKIRPQKQMLVMQNRLTCPYYDGKKCLIYKVRPLICKEFYCYKKPTAELGNKFKEEEYITVDMWAVAETIDKYFK